MGCGLALALAITKAPRGMEAGFSLFDRPQGRQRIRAVNSVRCGLYVCSRRRERAVRRTSRKRRQN